MARWKGTLVVAVTGLWLGSLLAPGLSTARAETVACAAWPGEPAPLPRVDSPDPFLASWARLRAQELERLAFQLEPSDPEQANQTWEHLRCIDPTGAPGRPERERGREAAETPPVASAPEPRTPDWDPIDAKLGAAEALVRGARFQQALQAADQIRPSLASTEDAPGASLRRTQLEVLAATAQIALGHHQAARESFERALAADPELELDAESTSPKIRRVFDTVRNDSGRPGP